MDKITILMSTYNGEKYLEEQLKSLLLQKEVEVSIVVRDDGSTDKTTEILRKYENQLTWYQGENINTTKSFMELLYNAPDSDYYAFCDQDDFWLDDKLMIAIKQLKKCDQNKPQLYYGCPRLVNEKLEILENKNKKMSEIMLDFRSALLNSYAVGCTMVFNNKLLEIIKNAKKPDYIYMHDEWIHKVCTLFKGEIVYDPDVHILYRQHGNNVIGAPAKETMSHKIKGHYNSIKNHRCKRSKTIESLYNVYYNDIGEEERNLLALVVNYKKNIISQFKLLFNREIKTNYLRQNILFKIAILLKIF